MKIHLSSLSYLVRPTRPLLQFPCINTKVYRTLDEHNENAIHAIPRPSEAASPFNQAKLRKAMLEHTSLFLYGTAS